MMDLPTRDIDGFLRTLGDGGVGLEFRIKRAKAPLDIAEATDALLRIQTCKSLIVAFVVFGRWTTGDIDLADAETAAASELRRALLDGSDARSLGALGNLARSLGLSDPRVEGYPQELRFDFVGAYRENPTALRFLAYGSVFSLGLAVTTFAAVQGKKEWDAEACRARVQDIGQMQLAILSELAHKEGRWSPQHAASHKLTVEAAQVASRACGSVLNGMELQLHLPPGVDFEIRLGPPPPAPAPGG